MSPVPITGINLQSPQSDLTPWTLTLPIGFTLILLLALKYLFILGDITGSNVTFFDAVGGVVIFNPKSELQFVAHESCSGKTGIVIPSWVSSKGSSLPVIIPIIFEVG